MDKDIWDAEGAGGVPPSSGLADSRAVKLENWEVGMGVVIGGRGLRGGRAVANEGVHLEAAS